MPRRDPSFTDGDLIRFFCKNLDPAEKQRVIRRFQEHIIHRAKICEDDIDVKTDFCKWAKAFAELTTKAREAGKVVPYVLSILTALEVALNALSWAGWLGKALIAIRVAVTALISITVFFGAIIIMVGQMGPFAGHLVAFFCEYQNAELNGEPPNPNGLPKSPDEKLQELIDSIQSWFSDAFTPDTTTPPDYWPPDFPIGP